MAENLWLKLHIIVEQFKQSQFFLSCTSEQWHAYLIKSNNLISFYYPKLMTFQGILIFLDIYIYIILIMLVFQFGRYYRYFDTKQLLIISGRHSYWNILFILCSFCLLLVWYLKVTPLGFVYYYIGELYRIDCGVTIIKVILLLLWLLLYYFFETLLVSSYKGGAEFSILSYLVLCFSFTILSAEDIILFLICLEGFSLVLYVIATLGRLQGGVIAAVKYFTFGTIGSILIFWGVVHLYEVSSTLSLSGLFYMFNTYHEFSILSGSLGRLDWAAIIILAGFLVKLGVAPMHQWVPDVYAGVPLVVTSFFAIFVKFALYIYFMRFAYHMLSYQELEYAAFLSLAVGCFGTLRQVEIKRFLAYGSIVHIGFLLIGDLVASFIYLFAYVIASFVFFSVLLMLRLNGHELVYLSDLRYLGQARQWDKLLLLISLVSIAGLPPFAGFYGKILVWISLLEDIYLFSDRLSILLLIINFLVSLVIIFYYIRLVIFIYIGAESSDSLFVLPYTYNSFTLSSFKDLNFFIQVKTEVMEVQIIQYMGGILLFLWTFFIPSLLTVSNVISMAFFH